MIWIEGLAVATIVCLAVQVYHYAGYPLLLAILTPIFGRKTQNYEALTTLPTSLIICAHNEEGVIKEKLENSLSLDPPVNEIIVVNDGSEDQTLRVAKSFEGKFDEITVLDCQPRGGKAKAMNTGAEAAKGDFLVFSDSSEMYETSAIGHLVEEFSDPTVAVVSGSHRLTEPKPGSDGALTGQSEGLYWAYEDRIRRMESRIGSAVASVGAMLAIRREDWHPLPDGTINDDAWIAMSALARGRNVRFAHNAIGWERPNDTTSQERSRRRRISAGRFKLLSRSEIWPFRRPWIMIEFLSHKVLRLFLPIFMILGFLANFALVSAAPGFVFYQFTMALQCLSAALALLGYLCERSGVKLRLPHLAYHVVASNLMILRALIDVALGQDFVKWRKPSR